MAKYGEFKYGQDKYGATTAPTPIPGPPPITGPSGPPPPAHHGSGSGDVLAGIPSLAVALGVNVEPFTAESLDYGYNLISWTSPAKSKVDTIRLVRNGTGYPTDENDGVILYTGPVGTNRFEDRGVQEGQEYFYGLFIKLNSADILTPSTLLTPDQGMVPGVGSGAFFPAAIARCIAVQKHGGRDTLLAGLPRIYTSPQSDAVGEIDSNSDLAAFMQLFGFQLDKVKTDLTNMLPFWDATRVPGPMVAPLARTFGQELEFGLGYRQSRILARDSSYIYSRKGTTSGVNAFAKALTGQGAKTIISPNLLRGNDATFASGTGSWRAGEYCAISYISTVGYPHPTPSAPAVTLPGGFVRGTYGALAVKCNDGSSDYMTVRFAGTADTGWGTAVQPGQTYALRIAFKSADPSGGVGNALLPGIEWRDSNGKLLSTSQVTNPAQGWSGVGTWSEANYYTATAPAKAAYASPLLMWANVSGTSIPVGEVQYVGAAQFERVNVPLSDGSMDSPAGVNPWMLVNPGGTSMQLDGTTARSGQSLRLDSSAAGLDAYATQSVSVTPGRFYIASAFANVPSFTSGAKSNRGLYVNDGTFTDTVSSGGQTATTSKVLPPPTGAYVGFLSPLDTSTPARTDIVLTTDLEGPSGISRKFDIVPQYSDFGSGGLGVTTALYDGGSITTSSGTRTITGGRIPLILWSTANTENTPGIAGLGSPGGSATTTGGTTVTAWTYDQILNGVIDGYLTNLVTFLKSWNKPVMIAFDPWADLYTSLDTVTSAYRRAAAGSGTTTKYAQAWQYIKSWFDGNGVTNVTWVYLLSGESGSDITSTALDPDDYDWIGVSSYVESSAVPVADRFQSFLTRLDKGEAGAAGKTKPVLVQWGVTSAYGSRVGAFSQVVPALSTGTLGRVKALVYDNTGSGSFTSTSGEVTAFASTVNNTYLHPSTINILWTTTRKNPGAGNYTTITAATTGWVQHATLIQPISSQLEIRLYSPRGTVFWDDVTVYQVAASPYADPSRTDVLLFSDRTNFVTNPNFETSSFGWSKTPTASTTTLTGYSSGATIVRSTAQHYSNTASLQVTPPAGATAKSGATTILSDLTPGQVYTISAQVLVTAAPLVSIEHDGAPFTVSGATASAVSGTVTPKAGGGRAFALTVADPTRLSESCLPQTLGKWSRITCTFVATRNVHTIGFYVTNTASATAFFLDEVMVEAGPVLNAYFDGNTSPDTDWEGTANLSRSHYTRAKAVKSKRLAARMPEYLPVGIPYAVRLAWPGA